MQPSRNSSNNCCSRILTAPAFGNNNISRESKENEKRVVAPLAYCLLLGEYTKKTNCVGCSFTADATDAPLGLWNKDGQVR